VQLTGPIRANPRAEPGIGLAPRASGAASSNVGRRDHARWLRKDASLAG
jgi:hypothetical protein